jgi:hypothetical protein
LVAPADVTEVPPQVRAPRFGRRTPADGDIVLARNAGPLETLDDPPVATRHDQPFRLPGEREAAPTRI